jgi:hypothetical protein
MKTKYLQQHPINVVRFWINVFIPQNIPGITSPVPGGEHVGKTMVPHPAQPVLAKVDPWVVPLGELRELAVPMKNAGYLTDQRSFSPDINASSRMHASAEILLNGMSPQMIQTHWSDKTVEVNVNSGKVTCQTHATEWTKGTCRFDFMCTDAFRYVAGDTLIPSRKNVYGNPVYDDSGSILNVHVAAEAGDPCTIAGQFIGKIDFEGVVSINLATQTISYNGNIGDVPAYEMYGQFDNGPIREVFKETLTEGAQFTALVGKAKRRVSKSSSDH